MVFAPHRLYSLALVLFTLFALTSRDTTAAPITYRYQGVIDSATGGPAFTALLGETMRITVVVESTTPDANPGNTSFGVYSAGVLSLKVTIPSIGATYVGGPAFLALVQDDVIINGIPTDQFGLSNFGLPGNLSGPSIGGFAPFVGAIILWDFSQAGFASDALPLTAPSLDDFGDTPPAPNASGLTLRFDNAGGPTLNASPATLQLVPEPGALFLFGAAGLLMSARCARRRPKLAHK